MDHVSALSHSVRHYSKKSRPSKRELGWGRRVRGNDFIVAMMCGILPPARHVSIPNREFALIADLLTILWPAPAHIQSSMPVC